MDANTWTCPCGYKFLISRNVLRRPLDCHKCGRYWLYIRHKGNRRLYRIVLLGYWNSPLDRELSTRKEGLTHAADIKRRRQAEKDWHERPHES